MNPCIEGAAEFCKKVGYTKDQFIKFLRTTYPVSNNDIEKAKAIYEETKQILNQSYLTTRGMNNVVYIDRSGVSVGQRNIDGVFQRNDAIWPWVEDYKPTEADWINIGWEIIKAP